MSQRDNIREILERQEELVRETHRLKLEANSRWLDALRELSGKSVWKRVDRSTLDALANAIRPVWVAAVSYSGEEAVKRASEAHQKTFREEMDRASKEKVDLAQTLSVACTLVEPRPSADGVIWRETHRPSTYRTQTAAASYARGRAELKMMALPDLGESVEILEEDEFGETVYVVMTEVVDDTDAAIVESRHLGTPEFVATCWKKGLNPRVYYPMLDPRFEELNGIDSRGNLIK